MSDEMKRAKAQRVYELVCAVLDEDGAHYDRADDTRTVRLGVCIEEVPVTCSICVDEERQQLRIIVPTGVEMKPHKRVEGAVITTLATTCLWDGHFKYDLYTGAIEFHRTASFRGSEIGAGLITDFLQGGLVVARLFGPDFSDVNDGAMSVDEFILTL